MMLSLNLKICRNIFKLIAWNLYRRHFTQHGDPVNKMESFLSFSSDIANALINAYKPIRTVGRPSKHSSIDKSAVLVRAKKLQLQLLAMMFFTIKWAIGQRQLNRSSGADFAKLIHLPSVQSFIMPFERKKFFQELSCKTDRCYRNIHQLF